MKRPVIAIVSVLKPIDDTRMYEKIGLSLGESTKYDVKIIGFPANKDHHAPNINFFPLPFFKRLSLDRFRSHRYIRHLLRELTPDIVIVATPELLPMVTRLRNQLSFALVYDVQENYSMNLSSQGIYPFPINRLLSRLVGYIETKAARSIDYFLLAEAVYERQLTWLPDRRYTILENKSQLRPAVTDGTRGRKQLLFTGTLAQQTGVLEAIELAKLLHQADSDINLQIIGYAPEKKFRRKLKHAVAQLDFVCTTGIDHLVSHQEILTAIQQADAGIICYPDHPSTRGKIPTKLFEYLAMHLPIFMPTHSPLLDMTQKYPAAIPFNPAQPDARTLLMQWNSINFYKNSPGAEVIWDSQEEKLLTLINSLF